MRLNIYKNITVLFFVSAFLFIRLVDAHVFSHFTDENDDLIHCELCEIIIASNNFTPFINNASEKIGQKAIIDFPEYKIVLCYKTSQYSVTLPESVYNKPPPLFLI